MTIKKLVSKMNLKILTEHSDLTKDVRGCYIGDLLSWAMTHAKQDNVFITIMGNINTVAVASLTDCACILMCDGASFDEDALERANSRDVVVLQSEKSAFELAGELHKIGI